MASETIRKWMTPHLLSHSRVFLWLETKFPDVVCFCFCFLFFHFPGFPDGSLPCLLLNLDPLLCETSYLIGNSLNPWYHCPDLRSTEDKLPNSLVQLCNLSLPFLPPQHRGSSSTLFMHIAFSIPATVLWVHSVLFLFSLLSSQMPSGKFHLT